MYRTLRSGKTLVIELWQRRNTYYASIRTKGSLTKQIWQAHKPHVAINLALKDFKENFCEKCGRPQHHKNCTSMCDWCGQILYNENRFCSYHCALMSRDHE